MADHAAWNAGRDNHGASRRERGAIRDEVRQSVDESNDLLALVEFESLADTKAFARDPSSKEVMSAAGVVGALDISFRETSDEVTC